MVLALFSAIMPMRAENACSGVDRTLSKQRVKAIGPAIAKQLDAKRIEILQSLQFGGWSILYVDTHKSDEAYVFYSGDPTRSKLVTLWSGAARVDEEEEIRAWTLENARGIPKTLASCFAWQVTKGRYAETFKMQHQ